MFHQYEVEHLPEGHVAPEMIRAELARLNWSQQQAALFLRINERTFRRYLQEGPGSTPMPFPTFALLKLTIPREPAPCATTAS